MGRVWREGGGGKREGVTKERQFPLPSSLFPLPASRYRSRSSSVSVAGTESGAGSRHSAESLRALLTSLEIGKNSSSSFLWYADLLSSSSWPCLRCGSSHSS